MNNWFELAKFLGPIILAKINPHVAQVSDSIIHGIGEAEKMKNASSDEKLQHAINITNDAVKAINDGTGKELINPAIVNDAASHAISTIVDVVNLIHKSPANINK